MYQKILIKSYQGKGETTIRAIIIFNDKVFQYEGDHGIITSIKNGLPSPTDARVIVSEADGQQFVDAILARYNSPYLYAELEK